jgi:hypothetical protein
LTHFPAFQEIYSGCCTVAAQTASSDVLNVTTSYGVCQQVAVNNMGLYRILLRTGQEDARFLNEMIPEGNPATW